ncbi:MAG TPA: 30S ribosomal protein S16 [Acidimicrobiia bacterium]
MSVKIRLMRVGKKKQPTYRVVVADSRSPRDGRIIEAIGKYGPRQEPSVVDIDGEKALGWLRKGAQPTEQVQKLLAATGVWAEYEKEKGGPVKTKLARRGVTPAATPPAPKPRPSKKAQAAAAAPAEQTVTEGPAADAAAADAPAAGEPAPEAPAGQAGEGDEETSS